MALTFQGRHLLMILTNDHALCVSEAEVRSVISSFPAGSSGGPDGLGPQHLKALAGCRIAGPELIASLTAFVNLLLAGKCPVAKCFFGGKLIAIKKDNGDVRPIVIGFVMRRLASKLANSFGLTRISSSLCPTQIGAGVKGGCEAAIHATRRFVEGMSDDDVIVKLDFRNAFNCLHRDDIFKEVQKNIPELLPYVNSSYGRPTILRFGSSFVSSAEGTQQGDPLGALLFCLAIHPLIESLSSDLVFGYPDDLTIGGSLLDVERDVKRVIDVGADMGLSLNVTKSELLCPNGVIVAGDVLSTFSRVEINKLTLLGAPLFSGPALDEAWAGRCTEMSKAISKLKNIPSQDSLILLRSSLGAPRIQHLLRCSFEVDHKGIILFDSLQREALSSVTNTTLSDNNWLQSKLPIKEGGLGIRAACDLAMPSLLASTHCTSTLQDASCLKELLVLVIMLWP